MQHDRAVELLSMCIADMQRVCSTQKQLSANASFIASRLTCHSHLLKVRSNSNKTNLHDNCLSLLNLCLDFRFLQTTSRASHKPTTRHYWKKLVDVCFLLMFRSFARSRMLQVIRATHRMAELYSGMSASEFADVLQLRVFTQAVQVLHLLAQSHDSSDKKQTCVHFLRIATKLDRCDSASGQSVVCRILTKQSECFRFLTENKLEGSKLMQALQRNMRALEPCDPVVFFKVLKDAVTLSALTLPTLTSVLREIRVEILKPAGFYSLIFSIYSLSHVHVRICFSSTLLSSLPSRKIRKSREVYFWPDSVSWPIGYHWKYGFLWIYSCAGYKWSFSLCKIQVPSLQSFDMF